MRAKVLTSIFFLLFILTSPCYARVLTTLNYTGTAASGDGFVGNNDTATDTSNASGTDDLLAQAFVASSSGTVSYMHCEQDSSYASGSSRMGIYDSSDNLLAETAEFSNTGGVIHAALTTPIEITASTTYYLVIGTPGDSFWRMAGKFGGTVHEANNQYLNPGDNLPDPINRDTTNHDTNHTMRIWADNSAT